MIRRNPYKVPEGYLDTLAERISERVQSVERGEEFVDDATIGWGQAWKRLIGFAAGFALLVGFGWTMVYLSTDKTKIDDDAYAAGLVDTARFLWVMSEDDVIEIIDHKANYHNFMAEVTEKYLAFYGEADDINLIYYE